MSSAAAMSVRIYRRLRVVGADGVVNFEEAFLDRAEIPGLFEALERRRARQDAELKKLAKWKRRLAKMDAAERKAEVERRKHETTFGAVGFDPALMASGEGFDVEAGPFVVSRRRTDRAAGFFLARCGDFPKRVRGRPGYGTTGRKKGGGSE